MPRTAVISAPNSHGDGAGLPVKILFQRTAELWLLDSAIDSAGDATDVGVLADSASISSGSLSKLIVDRDD
jgi:hypothetical protein